MKTSPDDSGDDPIGGSQSDIEPVSDTSTKTKSASGVPSKSKLKKLIRRVEKAIEKAKEDKSASPILDNYKITEAFALLSIHQPGKYGDLRSQCIKLKIKAIIFDKTIKQVVQVMCEKDKTTIEGFGDNHRATAIAQTLSPTMNFNPETQSWWHLVDGKTWVMNKSNEERLTVKKELEILKREGFTNHQLRSITELVADDCRINKWETARHLLPMQNSILNINTKELIPYSQHNLPFNWILPYPYDTDAKCRDIKRTLLLMAGNDKEFYKYLLAILCAVLFGWYDLELYFELIGPGGTGKSTFIYILERLVGENNTVTTDLKLLDESRFESANLYSKRLALVPDADQYKGGGNAILKQITGGDLLRYETKHKQAGKPFKYTGIFAIATNQATQTRDYSSGETRRHRPVPFAVRVTDKDKKRFPDIRSVIDSEMSGLSNLLLKQDREKARQLLVHPPKCISDFMLETQFDTNTILGWANEWLVKCKGDEIPTTVGNALLRNRRTVVGTESVEHLFPSYQIYCQNIGQEPVSLTKFSNNLVDQLQTRGIDTKKEKHRTRGNYLTGLRLRTKKDKKSPLLIEHIK